MALYVAYGLVVAHVRSAPCKANTLLIPAMLVGFWERGGGAFHGRLARTRIDRVSRRAAKDRRRIARPIPDKGASHRCRLRR